MDNEVTKHFPAKEIKWDVDTTGEMQEGRKPRVIAEIEQEFAALYSLLSP